MILNNKIKNCKKVLIYVPSFIIIMIVIMKDKDGTWWKKKTNISYYNEIKNKLIDDEVYSNVKNYSKEKHKVITYFEIGRLLNEAGGKYGEEYWL